MVNELTGQATVKSTRFGGKNWFNAVFFGLIGQIAWVVENMYFATFAQNLFEDGSKFGNAYFVATTLMVIFSAITATATTIIAGARCDSSGKRKPFITIGYLIWGVTIMLFAAIPIDFDASKMALIIALLVVFDCIMTVAGSTANDAAFNTWITDNTDVTNRGKVNTILSTMPVFGMVAVIVIAMFTFDKETRTDYMTFFLVLGAIPIIASVISFFTIKDSPNIVKKANKNYWKDTFYGFSRKVGKENPMMYVCLSALCLVGISQQVFMSYLINFVQKTLGIEQYIIPLGVVIVVSALITGLMGILFDKFGRKNFYIPLLGVIVAGTLVVYLMKFMPSSVYLPLLYVGGILMLGSMICMGGALMSTFQDYIPKGYEGRFQGVRMCFTVLIPMIIGPIISLAIGINSFDINDSVAQMPPFEIFLASTIVAVLAFIPIFFVRRDSDNLRRRLLDEKGTSDAAALAAKETVFGEPAVGSNDVFEGSESTVESVDIFDNDGSDKQ